MKSLTCPQCNKSFKRENWATIRRKTNFCSPICYWQSLKGKPSASKFKGFSITPTKKQIEFIVGTTLGDGYLHLRGRQKNAYLSIAQVDNQFTLWKKKILGSLAPTKVSIFYRQSPNKNVYRCISGCHPIFTKFRKLFYPRGRKIITSHVLKYLSPFAIATWYMDDGSLIYFTNHKGKFYLKFSTDSFTLEENELLQKFFKNKYKLNSVIYFDHRTNAPYLVFRYEEAKKLIKLIKQYIIPSMHYKLGF